MSPQSLAGSPGLATVLFQTPCGLAPHEFDLNLPKVFAELRQDTWQSHAVPEGCVIAAAGNVDAEAIASQLDMPVGSIGPTRARCFKKLEKILLDMGYEPVFQEEEETELKNNLAS